MSGGISLAGSACCDLRGCPFLDELVISKVPAINTIPATGTSHADQPPPSTATFVSSLFSSLRPKPAGTSSIRSSPENATTCLVHDNTHAQPCQLRLSSSTQDTATP